MQLKVINRKKFFRSITFLVIVLSFISLSFLNKSSSKEIQNFKTITVTEGDTLWSIAEYEKEENSYYNNFDIRDIIHSIKKINNLKTSSINVNQNLIIPTNT